jgi:hypothetical protein
MQKSSQLLLSHRCAWMYPLLPIYPTLSEDTTKAAFTADITAS